MRTGTGFLLALTVLVASGCAGFRGGVFSAPYAGDHEPDMKAPSTPYERWQRQTLQFPGVKLEVSLNNLRQAYNYEVMLFVIPTHLELGDGQKGPIERPLEVSLTIIPSVQGFTFDPRKVRVSIDGRNFETLHGSTDDSISSHHQLDKIGSRYSFMIRFGATVPAPENDIQLDLSGALQNIHIAPIPLIKFKKLGWSEGYS